MEFRVLGPLEVVDGDRDLTPPRPKQRAVLAVLLLRAGEVVSADELVDALWGERPPPVARNAVQGHVAALRKLLGADRIETRGGGYVLRLGDGELDLDRFERLVTGARGRHPEQAAAMLAAALALFRGNPLEDFRYEAFAAADAARLDELRLTALEERVAADLALGGHAEVVAELERLCAAHPLRERFHAQLMVALYRSGRQAEALEAYRAARRTLLDQLGLEPGPELQRIERQILTQDPGLELAQAGPAPPRVELPTPPNPLLGRAVELAEAREILLRPDVRLVTLTGPGGTGKTRLALELARGTAGRFARGTFFVPLAPLSDSSLVVATVAGVLGVRATPARPLARAIGDHLGQHAALLVLDNFEHVVAAAVDVADLLAAAPGLKVLVTSREALRIMGEHRYPVPPLDADAAATLFFDRARALRPDLQADGATRETVDEICRRLDRLPLSIELAAARMTLFSPAALLDRLGDRLGVLTEGFRDQPARQQTLKRTLEWSYELLAPAEQRVFRSLGVFAGGWTLDAAAAVCAEGSDVMGALSSLVDKSLLQLAAADAEPRPYMLETIREYARERLGQGREAEAVGNRHAEYFLALAEDAEPKLPLSPRPLLDALEREHDNLRAAYEWFAASGQTQRALALAGSLWRFWYLRGHIAEGRRRLERALAADERPTAARAKCLSGAGAMAMNVGDPASAKVRSEQARELSQLLGNASGAAYATFMLANAVAAQDDVPSARRLYEESVRTFRDVGDEHYALLASRHLAFAYERLGERERARTLHEENLRSARATGDGRIAATALGALADYALQEGALADARAMLTESLRIHGELRDVLDSAVDLSLFARVVAEEGRLVVAVRLVASLEALGDQIGARRARVARTNDETLAAVRERLDEAAFAEAWAEGTALSLDDAVALALADAD